MSYILDALQRSDNERTVSHVPTLGSGRKARRRRRTDWRQTLVGLLAIGLILLFLAFWFRAQLADMITDLRGGDDVQAGLAANAPPPPKPQTSDPQATQAPGQPRARTETVRIQVPQPAPRQRAPAQRVAPAQRAVVNEEVYSRSTGQMAQPAGQSNAQSVQETVQNAIQPAPASSSPENTVSVQTEQANQDEVEDSNNLPSNVRRDLPQMQLNVVSYSSNPEKRFVMIDQKILREGDSAPGGMTIEEITSDGPVMAWRGRRFLMRP